MNMIIQFRSLSLLATALLLSACVTPSQAQTFVPPTIETLGASDDPSGGCTITYRMTNNFGFTFQMSADLFITDAEGNTLGQSYGTFPPALPGKSSQANFRFFAAKIAGGSCSPMKGLRFKGRFCKSINDQQYIRKDLCDSIEITSTRK